MYQRSQHIREATQTVDSIWGAHQLSQTGSLHLDLGDVETAAPLIEQAEQILLHLGLAQTPEPWGTQTRMIVGLLRTAQGRHEAAVTAFEQAKEVATACGNLESRGGALILTGYGVALAAAGDRPMAEAQLREAKRIRENCGILDTGGGVRRTRVVPASPDPRARRVACWYGRTRRRQCHRWWRCAGGVHQRSRIGHRQRPQRRCGGGGKS